MTAPAELLHLARRFLGSLSPRPLADADDRWARRHLLPAEEELWARMPVADRKHAARAAREVHRRAGDAATRPVVAAALLHDVGKVASRLGTFGRVGATLATGALGRERVAAWRLRRGLRRRVGLYAAHPRVGAGMLTDAGADPFTVAWAREHHSPEERWSVPTELGRVLRAVDDD